MVFITEQLIRKKSEHNELIISTLEELSLHQEDIEKIEHIQNWCKNLQILLLQNNLISKIENLHKLKRLVYLNLAINNIEIVENLHELESLKKLDLTLNFIGTLTSVKTLSNNYNLEELILTGNPCTDYQGYRDYVITILSQLKMLDGLEVKRSDRIVAKRNFARQFPIIIQSQINYQFERDKQKLRIYEKQMESEMENKDLTEDEKSKKFWEQKSEHCPETRLEISKQHRRVNEIKKEEIIENRVLKLFADCGRPYNINQCKLEFRFDDKPDAYQLELFVYKYLDTSLIDVDVQPRYVRVTTKKKIFQMALQDEVKTDESTSQRNLSTGHLLIIMPKLNYGKEINFTNNQIMKDNTNAAKNLSSTKHSQCAINYRNIVQKSEESDTESEVPPLI